MLCIFGIEMFEIHMSAFSEVILQQTQNNFSLILVSLIGTAFQK